MVRAVNLRGAEHEFGQGQVEEVRDFSAGPVGAHQLSIIAKLAR
jgi:hypothetical protein